MTTPTLLEAARALAMARERLFFYMGSKPDTPEGSVALREDRSTALSQVHAAEAALDAAYKAEEYGGES